MDRVLLIEDSVDCQKLVSRALHDSVKLEIASAVLDAKALLETRNYDLLLLDVDLPDGNGFGLCSSLLAETTKTHRPRVVFLTGSLNLSEKLTGFSVGADDYITKPFDPFELKARVQAQLRTHAKLIQSADMLKTGDLVLNLTAHSAEIHRPLHLPVRLDLTPTEFKLLHMLTKNEGRVLSREQLLTVASDHAEDTNDRTIDAHLSKLRKKIGICSHEIEAVYGVGYRWILSQ